MDLAVVVVSYNVRSLLAACLDSVYDSLHHNGPDTRVMVVDNASTDGSAGMVRDRFPQVDLVASPTNLGFAAANNVAIRSVVPEAPRYVLLLNPDTEVRGDALGVLVRFMDEHPEVGAAGAKLVYPDGRLQHGAFRFPGVMQTFFDFFPIHPRLAESRLNGRYPRSAYADGPFPIDHPLGACLMLRAETIRQVGLLDEQFFIYCEEIDWCLRIKGASWPIYCVPRAEIVHHAGQSTRQFRNPMFVALWRSRLRLYRKHYSPARRWAICQVARLGVLWKLRREDWRNGASRADEQQTSRQVYREVLDMLTENRSG